MVGRLGSKAFAQAQGGRFLTWQNAAPTRRDLGLRKRLRGQDSSEVNQSTKRRQIGLLPIPTLQRHFAAHASASSDFHPPPNFLGTPRGFLCVFQRVLTVFDAPEFEENVGSLDPRLSRSATSHYSRSWTKAVSL